MDIYDVAGNFDKISINTFTQLCRSEGYLTYLKQNFPTAWNKLLDEIDGDELEYSKTYKKTKTK
jgi:hypothetical protein